MRADDPNLASLELAALALGPLLDELVLVGGCAVGLLITDPSVPPVRATLDVDLLTEVTPLSSYYALQERLRERGFVECPEVICRWQRGVLKIDVMPTDARVLGFTNPWYATVARTAQHHTLPSGAVLQVISAPLFLATKLSSFRSRGAGDYLHHDMEDIVNLLDGRPTLVDEVRADSTEVQDFLYDECEALLLDARFADRLPWLLGARTERVGGVLKQVRRLCGL